MRPLTYDGLAHVVRNMRAADREECFATNYPTGDRELDDEGMILRTLSAGTERGLGFLAYHDEEPVAAIGMTLAWPGVASVWMFATDCWALSALALTRWAKKTMIPVMKEAGIHRAQCWSMSGHSVAHRWLNRLGATEEAVAPGFGRNGETFHLFAWSKGRNF